MTKYPSFAIVFSFFGLWLTSHFSADNQVFMGFVFILSFGILHGANDLLIMKNLLTKNKTISFSEMLFCYILIVLAGGLLFYLLPWFVLIFFVIISGFHFGEQQIFYLEGNKNKFLLSFFQILYGLLVLFLLFSFHQEEVQTIVAEISKIEFPSVYIYNCLLVLTVLFGICFLYLYTKNTKYRSHFLLEIFYLLVFAIIFKVASLIWGFAIFFIVWHSIPSIIDQVKFLYGDFSKNNCIAYFKSAVVYWIVSLIGLGVFYFVFKDLKLFNSMFFSFLAAITFPHVLVILKMFDTKQN